MKRFDRRTLLRGTLVGGAISMGLPLLDCFLNEQRDRVGAGRTAPGAVRRLDVGLRHEPGSLEPDDGRRWIRALRRAAGPRPRARDRRQASRAGKHPERLRRQARWPTELPTHGGFDGDANRKLARSRTTRFRRLLSTPSSQPRSAGSRDSARSRCRAPAIRIRATASKARVWPTRPRSLRWPCIRACSARSSPTRMQDPSLRTLG